MTQLNVKQIADRLVSQEVRMCVSHLVSTLAREYGSEGNMSRDAKDLLEQAFELACPVLDYEEAGRFEGWDGPFKDSFEAIYFKDEGDGSTWAAASWAHLCADHDIEPYEREVFEHWAVSNWLAERLIEKGEKVDLDFAGMNVWARTTSGQGIAMDSVIEAIARDIAAR